MKTLSFNTTGIGTQFALNIDGKGYYLERGFSKHSETFFPLLDEFLNQHKVTLKDIDCFGVVVGPGSFTGIRIGLSVAKMFAYVENKACVAVNSLEVLAYNIFKSEAKDCPTYNILKNKNDIKMVCSVINAGADNLYYQLFEVKGNGFKSTKEGFLISKFEPRICSCSQFEKLLSTKLKDAEILYYDNNEIKYVCEFLSKYKTNLTAEGLDFSVQAKIKEKDFTEYKKVLPLYIRGSQVDSIQIKSNEDITITRAKGNQKDIKNTAESQNDIETISDNKKEKTTKQKEIKSVMGKNQKDIEQKISDNKKGVKDLSDRSQNDIEDIAMLENNTDADDLPWNKKSIEESFKNPSYKSWIMRVGQKAVGYVSIMDLGEEYEILRIVVHSKARMQGAGQKILEYLIEDAKQNNVKSIVFEVNQFNYPALMLYEKLGFKVVGKREKYYHKGQDAWIMRKQI